MNHSWILVVAAVTTACATRSGTTSRAEATPTNGFQVGATGHTPADEGRNSSSTPDDSGRGMQHVAANSAAASGHDSASASNRSSIENRNASQPVTSSEQRSLSNRRGAETSSVDNSHTLQPASGPGATESGAGEHQNDSDRDNSRANQRDRSGKSLTPIDQGGSEADRKITQQIRQAIVADESLSFNAKNVKIITTRGKVTLRGPVKSDTERSAIDAIAKQIAGAANVENLVEVSK